MQWPSWIDTSKLKPRKYWNTMPEMKKLDLERHHQCVEIINGGGDRPRGLGFTTSFLNLMLAEIMVGAPSMRYLFIAKNRNNALFNKREFEHMVIREYGMSEITKSTIDSLNTSIGQGFRFISFDDFTNSNRMVGISVDRVFIDIGDLISNYNEYELPQFNYKIREVTHARRGDVI